MGQKCQTLVSFIHALENNCNCYATGFAGPRAYPAGTAKQGKQKDGNDHKESKGSGNPLKLHLSNDAWMSSLKEWSMLKICRYLSLHLISRA